MFTIKKVILGSLSILLLALVLVLGNLLTTTQKTATKEKEQLHTENTTTTTSEHSISTTNTTSEEIDPLHLPIDQWIDSDTEISFPILMYHSLSEGNSLKIPPEEFKQHMEWLKKENYYTLSPEEAYQVLTSNKKPSEKIVWVTFDDGYLNNYTEGFPILKELQLKATINYIISKEGADSYFNLSQMKEMSETKLVSIQSHTYNHLEVNTMSPEQQLSEMEESKKYLDEQLNQDTNTLCYPAGRYNEDNYPQVEKSGYKMALTTEPGYARASDGLFALKRVRVSPGYDGPSFGTLLNSFK